MTPCIICGKLVENRGITKYCWDCRKEKQRADARKKTRVISKASSEKYKKKQVEVYHQKFPNARYYSK